MSWQDVVITAGQIVFFLALLPSIFSEDKPALATSLTTGLVLIAFAFAYLSLDLLFAFATGGITAVCWLVLAYQKFRRRAR